MLTEKLAWVWNIAVEGGRPTSSASPAELRFLGLEVDAFAERGFSPCTKWSDAQVMRQLFGDERPEVPGTTFRRAFNCVHNHVMNLIRAKVLRVLPGTEWSRGPLGTPAIAWASAAEFVTKRRWIG